MTVVAPVVRVPLRLGLFAIGILGRIGHAWVSRQALGRVSDLDERLLRDIGLTRQDVWPGWAEPLFRGVPVGLARAATDQRRGAPAATPERHALVELRRRWTEECGPA